MDPQLYAVVFAGLHVMSRGYMRVAQSMRASVEAMLLPGTCYSVGIGVLISIILQHSTDQIDETIAPA